LESHPRVVLLSRLSIHSETLHKALMNICTVNWIVRKTEYRKDPVRFTFLLFREFFHILATCKSASEAGRPIIVVHSIGLDAIPAFAVRKVIGCKVVLYAVGSDLLEEEKSGRKSFLRWAVRKADVVLCGNGKTEAKLSGLGAKATKVLPAPFLPFKVGVDDEKEFDVVTVGSLTPAARQSLLVEASEYLDPSVKIAIIGEGPQRQYLTTLSRRHGRNQVSFLGELPPKMVHNALNRSSVYVRCSPYEGTASSVLEAACMGLPIIEVSGEEDPELTDVYGIRPIVPKDRMAVSLANAIQGAMENYSTLREDVSKNREALETYSESWPSMAAAALFS
jgi:glycosyltransferase involved in cell wall biosynthesis